MTVKAELKIQLWAGSELVAESQDQELWSRNFAAMRSEVVLGGAPAQAPAASIAGAGPSDVPLGGSLDKLAAELGVTIEILQGACDPLMEPPYMRLDVHRWAALKQNTPKRGRNSFSPISVAATLLCLWFRFSRQNKQPSIKEAQDVLDTIRARDHNPSRSIDSCPWLRHAGSAISIKPDEISSAMKLARAFCLKQPPGDVLEAPQGAAKRRSSSPAAEPARPAPAATPAPAPAPAPAGTVGPVTLTGREGATLVFRRLLQAGYFDVPRSGDEVRRYCADKLRKPISTPNVHGKLGDLVRQGVLERTGERGGFRYSAVHRAASAVAEQNPPLVHPRTQPTSRRVEDTSSVQRPTAQGHVARPAAKRPLGAQGLLRKLVGEGHFDRPRTQSEVRMHIKHAAGRTLDRKETPRALQRLVQEGLLKRELGTSNEYEYMAVKR
jgi:hypothetical protein